MDYHFDRRAAVTAVEQTARMDQPTSFDLAAAVRGCTFDDFLFTPQFSVVERRDSAKIDLSCQLSAVTTSDPQAALRVGQHGYRHPRPMAIVQAEEGGIGVIDRGFKAGDIESQVREVEVVKRTQHGVIADPYTISMSASLNEARAAIEGSRVGTLVVVDEHRKLKGLLTERDVRFVADAAHASASSVAARMTPLEKLAVQVGPLAIEEAVRIMVERKVKKLPLVDEQGVLTGLVTARDIIKQKRLPFATRDAHGRLRVAAAIGAKGDYLERAAELIRAGVDLIVIDIAHGHSVVMERALREFRICFGEFEVVAGNVATAEGARFLADRGVNGVKVGVGPGGGVHNPDQYELWRPSAAGAGGVLGRAGRKGAGRRRRRGAAGRQRRRSPAVGRRLRHAGEHLCGHVGDARRDDPQIGAAARISKAGKDPLQGPTRNGLTRRHHGPVGRRGSPT